MYHKTNPKMTEQTPEQIEHDENMIALLESDTWERAIMFLFEAELASWKKSLLTDPNLTDDRRQAYIMSRRTILSAFRKLYSRHEIETPQWLSEEK